MARTGNYTAFYVAEPFHESNLGAFATKDFVTYSQLRAWKGLDSSFPFVDSHEKNYNVRDGSDWEATLKPRLRDRLNKSKKHNSDFKFRYCKLKSFTRRNRFWYKQQWVACYCNIP